MTQETATGESEVNHWISLPEVKVKFDIPADFSIEVPQFKKTSTMGRVEFECNDVIERLIGYKSTVERKTDAKIGQELGIHKGTVRDWRRKIGIHKPFPTKTA